VTDQEVTSVVAPFERALGEIRTRVSVSAAHQQSNQRQHAIEPIDRPIEHGERVQAEPALAVAYSGGLDSSALLHLACDYTALHGIGLVAFHIHHGISPHADDWLAHCSGECARLGIAFDARHINLDRNDKGGIEQAARIGRYAALGELSRTHRVPLLLTAHHQDDQAETVLLQLLRGSGLAGLSGMDAANTAPDLLGDSALIIGRPLLSVTRAALADFVVSKGIRHIEDESNTDTRYARNALRHQVIPALTKYFPGFQQRFARSAAHAQSAQRLLVDLAAHDLANCMDGECLDINRIKRLSTDRIDNLLRHWFRVRGVRMPSTAWLNEMRTQLLEAKADAQLCVTHADCYIRRHRDRVYITPKLDQDETVVQAQAFSWDGSTQMRFAAFGGILHFDPAEQGVAADWLRGRVLSIQLRSGGERLKLARNRPTKRLKDHYQAFDVPTWERERLPLVTTANQLLFAAGIGMNCHHLSDAPGLHIRFRWQPDGG
jgi:tRNA(Ile)-lysidine synthase